jgi:hypothetical protein
MADTVRINVELTDTFGGEANYCWVKRASFDVPADGTDRQAIRRAKALLDLSGIRHTKDSYGEGIVLNFPNRCMVAFLSYATV